MYICPNAKFCNRKAFIKSRLNHCREHEKDSACEKEVKYCPACIPVPSSSEPVNYRKLDVMALEESAYRGDDSAKAELIRRGFNSHDCGALADAELVDPQPDLQQLEDDIGFELCGEIKCNQECGGYLFCDKIETLVRKILRLVSDSQQAKNR